MYKIVSINTDVIIDILDLEEDDVKPDIIIDIPTDELEQERQKPSTCNYLLEKVRQYKISKATFGGLLKVACVLHGLLMVSKLCNEDPEDRPPIKIVSEASGYVGFVLYAFTDVFTQINN